MKLRKNKTSNTTTEPKKYRRKFKKFKTIKWIPINIADLLIRLFNSLKNTFVYRSYWGRGSTYKQAVHIVIFFITVVVSLSGLSYRIFGLNQSTQGLSTNYLSNSGNVDLLQQGSSLQSVLASNPQTPFTVNYYQVQEGDSMQSIADKFEVTKETIKWSNMDKYSNYDNYTKENISVGETLIIPEISGVLWAIQDGDNLDSIIQKTNGDKFQTIEVNQLNAQDNSIAGRKIILVPNGSLPAPQPPEPIYSIPFRSRPASGDCSPNGDINGVALSNPLCHPECSGYSFSRGLIYGDGGYLYHDGIDLAKGGGCPISAMCDGVVTRTGWEEGGGGYTVRISCGNGIDTLYYHGDGNIWVSAGQSVKMGDPVMYMGCTGLCTGTHLHFILRQNGITIDPAYYVAF